MEVRGGAITATGFRPNKAYESCKSQPSRERPRVKLECLPILQVTLSVEAARLSENS